MKIEQTQEEQYTENQVYQIKQAHIQDQESGAIAPEVRSYEYGEYIN